MSIRHSTPSNSKRPLSAIFIGDLNSNNPDQHSHNSQTQLPSPPSTQGSSKDGSQRSKSRAAPMTDGLERPSSRASLPRRWDPPNRDDDDDDDDYNNDNEDHTAKLSDERRLVPDLEYRSSSRAGLRRSGSAMDTDAALLQSQSRRAQNRQLIERMDAIASNGRLNAPSPRPSASRSPIPRPPSTLSSSNSARISHTRLRQDAVSGSETEREYGAHEDDHSTPPTSAITQNHLSDSRRDEIHDQYVEREPSSRADSRQSPRRSFTANSVSKRRGLTMLDGLTAHDSPLFTGAITAAVKEPAPSLRTSPHKTRFPLPREFRDRRGLDTQNHSGSVSPEEHAFPSRHRPSSRDRLQEYTNSPIANRPPSVERSSRPPSVLNGRLSRDYGPRATPNGYRSELGASTSTVTPSNSGLASSSSNWSVGRFNTVRERRTSHSRWASEDLYSPEEESNPNEQSDARRYRYQSRGGSAESALAGGRSLLGEGLKAAGLTRRRDDRDDDIFTPERFPRHGGKDSEPNGLPPSLPPLNGSTITYSSSSSSAITDFTTESQAAEMRRDRLSRLNVSALERLPEREGSRDRDIRSEHNRTPFSGARENRIAPSTTSRVLPSRPQTSIDPKYFDSRNPPRTAPPQLRTYRSALALPVDDRGYDSPSGLSRDLSDRERERLALPSAPSVTRRPIDATVSNPTVEHARLLKDALRSFEGNVKRAVPNIHPSAASNCIAAADTLVQAASILNSLLRSNADRAMEEQIDAEVGDGDGGADPEVWRRVGSQFRESIKYSDEIVRTMTALLLDVGKIMRDAATTSGTATPPPVMTSTPMMPTSSSGSSTLNSHLHHSRTMSLDEEALAARRADSGSADGRSVAGSGSGVSSSARAAGARKSVDGASVSSGGRRSLDHLSGRLSTDYTRRSVDESIRDRERDSGSLRRVVGRRSDAAYDQQRATTSLSHARTNGERDVVTERQSERERSITMSYTSPELDRQDVGRPKSVLAALSSRRLFQPRRTLDSPGRTGSPKLFGDSSMEADSPTPAPRPNVVNEERVRRFPPLAVPPPLSTLPSESVMEQSPSLSSATSQRFPNNGASHGTFSRRKTSIGSMATVTLRASVSKFPSLTSPSKPTTQITPTTVSTMSDREVAPTPSRLSDASGRQSSMGTRSSNVRTISASTSRDLGREQRQRSLSALSASESGDALYEGGTSGRTSEVEDWPNGTVQGRSSSRLGVDRTDRLPSSRSRPSLEGVFDDRDRRERRRTTGVSNIPIALGLLLIILHLIAANNGCPDATTIQVPTTGATGPARPLRVLGSGNNGCAYLVPWEGQVAVAKTPIDWFPKTDNFSQRRWDKEREGLRRAGDFFGSAQGKDGRPWLFMAYHPGPMLDNTQLWHEKVGSDEYIEAGKPQEECTNLLNAAYKAVARRAVQMASDKKIRHKDISFGNLVWNDAADPKDLEVVFIDWSNWEAVDPNSYNAQTVYYDTLNELLEKYPILDADYRKEGTKKWRPRIRGICSPASRGYP
ncbi:hypothetical protein FRB99_008377, partial [Tulasnella sp. 403]